MRSKVALLVLALVAVACGGGGSSGSPQATTPSQSPSGTEAVPGSFGTLRDLQLAVEGAFILCNKPLKVYDPPEVVGATEQADCRMDVGLFLFDPNDVQAGASALQGAAEGEFFLLVGNNWIVTCGSNQGSCEKIQAVAGGELLGAS